MTSPALHLPPGPAPRWWGLPLLRAMRADYLGFTSNLQRQHGDISFMRLGAERAYDLFTPDLVRAALVDGAEHLVPWQRGIEVFEQVFGQSVLVTEGATWQRQRRMLQAAFTPRRVAGYAALMTEAASQALDAALPAQSGEARVDMDALFTHLAMDVILRTLFSARASAEAADAADAVQRLSEGAMREMFRPFTLPDWLPLPGKATKRRSIRLLRELIGRHIAARRQAGHETTATALLWWSRLMADHPEAAARAQADEVAALPWLSATLKEAMRLYPPVAAVMTRRVTRDVTVGGWTLPRGALIRITPWVLQRDSRWYEAPAQFRSERFMPGAPTPPRGAWMPVGARPRVCLGQHFAMLEMTLITARLLQRYTLVLPAGTAAAEAVLNVTLRPRERLWLQLRRRPLQPGIPTGS